MISRPVPLADDHAALVHNASQGSTRDVITTITHVHGGFLQLAVIRRIRNYTLAGLETRRIVVDTSKSSDFVTSRLDRYLQAGDNTFRRFKSVLELSGKSSSFRLESEDRRLQETR